MTNIAFSQELAISFYKSKDTHPINVHDAAEWLGNFVDDNPWAWLFGSTIGGKRGFALLYRLDKKFKRGKDYVVRSRENRKPHRPSIDVMISVDCLKALAEMVGTPEGKNVIERLAWAYSRRHLNLAKAVSPDLP